VIRLRLASKAPLAIGGIIAAPVFFLGLMAFSLKFDKPTRSLSAAGKVVFGDPTKGTVGTIYALAFAVAVGVVLVGLIASLLRSRLAGIVPAVASIVVAVLLMLPLGTWAAEHTARYPLGTDNIPDHSPQNLMLRGEWEQSAQTTAHQIGLVTIGLAVAAILLTAALELRRRRGRDAILTGPPPPELETGGAPTVAGP